MSFEINAKSLLKNGSSWYLQGGVKGDLLSVTAKWCGHCTVLKQNVLVAQKTKRFSFYNLDGDNNRTQAQLMGVHGYPTMFKVIQGGQLVPYTGDRSVMSLVSNFGR